MSTLNDDLQRSRIVSRHTLSDGFEVEFIVQEEAGGVQSSPPQVTQDGEEVCIDFSNFSGRLCVRKVAPEEQSKLETKDQEEIPSLNREDALPEPHSQTPSGIVASSAREQDPNLPSLSPPIDGEAQQIINAIDTEKSRIETGRFVQNPMRSVQSSPRTIGTSLLSAQKRGRFSMQKLAQLSDIEDSEEQTPLHRLCASSSLDLRKMIELIEISPEMVEKKDAQGMRPLHIY